MNYPQLFALQPLIYGGLAESWRLYFLNDYTENPEFKIFCRIHTHTRPPAAAGRQPRAASAP